ncbi:MAG: alpha-mannosidase [Glaciecola sp.]|jgi:alpha-mannosidase
MVASRAPLELTVHHVPGEPIDYAAATAGDFAPIAIGDLWGPLWGTAWFHMRGQVPQDWAGKVVAAHIDLGLRGGGFYGGEGLIWHDGVPRQGIAPAHNIWKVGDPAVGGEDIDFFVEAAANPNMPGDPDPNRGGWPLLLPEPDGEPICRVHRAELVTLDTRVHALHLDMKVLLELAQSLGDDDRRAAELLRHLTLACRALDPDDIAGTAAAARDLLAPAFAAKAGSNAHTVTAVGHAHIDTAWLWPTRETRRKCSRTFASAVSLMDEFPDYHFVASQPQQYAWVQDDYPTLFARIEEKVAAGQFEPIGSMWIEADCNIPSGESLVRQFVHGKRYFLERFGVETRDLWLPDVFGYPAQLPQIMALAGVDHFLTNKLTWNDTNPFPHHTMWWEGLDGTRTFTHFPPSRTYIGNFSVAEVKGGADAFAEHALASRSLYPFGHGDGGGGPTREMIESARRMADLEGLPRVEMGSLDGFFAAAKQDAVGEELPVWVGELYAEFHRGTYTSQARTKALNRRAEEALHEAEVWWALLGDGARNAMPRAELDRVWKLLLLNQFHDILPGSSIHWVYLDTERELAEVVAVAQAATLAAISAALPSPADANEDLAARGRVVLFNSTGQERAEVVTHLPDPGLSQSSLVAVAPDGRAVPVQHLQDGGLAWQATVPAYGYTTYALRPTEAAPETHDLVDLICTTRVMDNGRLRVELDDDALITRLYDHVAAREVLAPGERGNVLQLFDDEPLRFDAWDIDRSYTERMRELTQVTSIEVIEAGPVTCAVRVRRVFGNSHVSQVLRLDRDSSALRVDVEVDWHERHKLLKVAFPLAVRAQRATYEVQFGHVERTTHRNTTYDLAQFEVCAHRWADLSEDGYGVALLNDSKYGYDCLGSTLRLSLLRASTGPDPEADQGLQTFTYVLLPHVGDLRAAGVIAAGESLNRPLRMVAVADGPHDLPRPTSLARVVGLGVVLDTIKPADDGDGLIVRMYEAFGGAREVTLELAQTVTRANAADLLERDGESLDVAVDGRIPLAFGPFEIRTVRLR